MAPPVCPAGYSSGGSICRASLTCPPQTAPSGGRCTRTLTTTCTASCPAGTQLWSSYGVAYDFKIRGPSTNPSSPNCSRGGSLGSSGICTISSTLATKLSCPADGWPVAGLHCQASPYCPATCKLLGTQCKK